MQDSTIDFALRDMVKTVEIIDAVNGHCSEDSTSEDNEIQLSVRSQDQTHQVNDRKPNFALIKTGCKIIKRAPYRLDHYAIVLCLSGTGQMTAGQYNFKLSRGSLHFVQPDMINVIEEVSENFQIYMVLFKRDFFSDMYLKDAVLESMLNFRPDFPPVSQLDADTFTRVKELIENMDREYLQKQRFHLKMIQSMLMQLFFFAGRIFEEDINEQPGFGSRGGQLVQQFKKSVEEGYLNKRTVQQYADELFVSAKYLGEVVKKETGETPIRLIHKRIYLESLYLLNYSYLSIKEISDTLNFDTPSHFSRFFKQFVGQTPTEFKNAMVG